MKRIIFKNINNPRKRSWMIALTSVAIVIAVSGFTTGGIIWHQQPGFCATCHTPMKNYVENYFTGDTTLLITKHAKCDTLQIKCLNCHESSIRVDSQKGVHWLTGNYTFPLEKRKFGTRQTCLTAGCHVEADIIEATKEHNNTLFAYNQHDSRHGKLQCNSCHSMHGQSVFSCNQCHHFELPAGWVSPQPNGVIARLEQ